MNRRVFLVGIAMLAVAPRARAQTDATQTQIDLALATASLAALRTRYGDGHADVAAARARVASLAQSLREARARNETIDVARVTSALDAELADTRARIGERSTRCGAGHPEMETAHAREAALTNAIAHVTSEGFFLPAS